MNHQFTEEEADITKDMDFIIPLKQIGVITRAVVESVHLFYRPRRIIVVTPRKEGMILRKLHPHWNIERFECIDEETFFQPNLGLSMDDITAEYDPDRPGDQREAGWWVQQLIKLGAATQIPDISKAYVVWDGDLVPMRRWKIADRDQNGDIRYFIAILQGESRSEFNTSQYAHCMRESVGFSPLEPESGGTFVTHHMVFQKKYVEELLNLMIQTTKSQLVWPKLIMSLSQKYYRFSEYKTYCTYMVRYHSNDFNYHDLSEFGEGGLRFRDANCVISEMLRQCQVSCGGISYQDVREYVLMNWKAMSLPDQVFPGYIQLDHVYGLDGIDIDAVPVCTETDVKPLTINVDTFPKRRRVSVA